MKGERGVGGEVAPQVTGRPALPSPHRQSKKESNGVFKVAMTGSHENNCYHVGQMRLEVRKKSWLSTCSSYLNYRNIKASDVLSDNPKTTSESKINSFYFMFVLQSWSLSPGPCTRLASIQPLGHISSTHSRFIALFQHLRVARCFQSSHFSFVCSFFFFLPRCHKRSCSVAPAASHTVSVSQIMRLCGR